MENNIKLKIQQINNSLNSATFQINLAKKLLKEIEDQVVSTAIQNIPGIFGKFMGDCMIADSGEKIDVPSNYASKSTLVYGDKLKMYEDNGERKFKQIERVKRFRTEGILTKKEGRWHVVTSDGSYKILNAAVAHWGGAEGDSIIILLPLDDKFAPFAALESIVGKQPVNTKYEDPASSQKPGETKVEVLVTPAKEDKKEKSEVSENEKPEAEASSPLSPMEKVMKLVSKIGHLEVSEAPAETPVPEPKKEQVKVVQVSKTKPPVEKIIVERVGADSGKVVKKKKSSEVSSKSVPVSTPVKAVRVTPVSHPVPRPAAVRVEKVEKVEKPVEAVVDSSKLLTDEDLR